MALCWLRGGGGITDESDQVEAGTASRLFLSMSPRPRAGDCARSSASPVHVWEAGQQFPSSVLLLQWMNEWRDSSRILRLLVHLWLADHQLFTTVLTYQRTNAHSPWRLINSSPPYSSPYPALWPPVQLIAPKIFASAAGSPHSKNLTTPVNDGIIPPLNKWEYYEPPRTTEIYRQYGRLAFGSAAFGHDGSARGVRLRGAHSRECGSPYPRH